MDCYKFCLATKRRIYAICPLDSSKISGLCKIYRAIKAIQKNNLNKSHIDSQPLSLSPSNPKKNT